MKKDIELIRKILIEFENNDEEYYYIAYDRPLNIEGYSDKEIAYNLKIMFDDGLIEGGNGIYGLEIAEVVAKPTSLGHDFINSTKDDGLWNSFKKKVGQEIQNMSITMMIDLLKKYAVVYFKNKLGID